MKFKSNLLAQASGSLGGTVFSHNRGGMYTRNRSIPTNPNTSKQQGVRAAMTSLVQYWTETLTAAERAAWTNWAANVPFINSLGDTFTLTGQQAFIRANTARVQCGLTLVTVAPTIFNNGEPITDIQSTANGTSNQYGIVAAASSTSFLQATAPSDGGALLIQFGRALNPSINFYKGPWQQMVLTGASVPTVVSATSPTDVTTTLAAMDIDDPLVIGQFRAVRARVSYDDGRLSLPYEVICEVVDDT